MKKDIERYWRDPKVEDLAKEPPLRTRCKISGEWRVAGNLTGYTRNGPRHWEVNGSLYETVQVYDAPDPGEGHELVDPTEAWRLIGVDEGAAREQGLEFSFGQEWTSIEEDLPFGNDAFYRRKIVPVPTSAGDATPVNCEQGVTVQVNIDGKKVLVRPLLPSDEINSGDIWIEDGVWERAYTAVGLLQSNADHQYYREVRPQPECKPEAAATKPEAAEPVTFVAHPIQINGELDYCFKGNPIQFRSYAVLNEQGHYLQHLPAYPPQYAPEFRQAFTPLQLLQLSVRELGSNIRLRAVEPVDVDKLKQEYMQELKEKLQPKASKREKVMWQGREYYVLTRFRTLTDHGHSSNVRVVLQDANELESYVAMAFADDLQEIPSEPQPEAPQPVKEPNYVPFTWEDRYSIVGKLIEHKESKKAEMVCEFRERSGLFLINGTSAAELLTEWRFVRNGEPAGKRVED